MTTAATPTTPDASRAIAAPPSAQDASPTVALGKLMLARLQTLAEMSLCRRDADQLASDAELHDLAQRDLRRQVAAMKRFPPAESVQVGMNKLETALGELGQLDRVDPHTQPDLHASIRVITLGRRQLRLIDQWRRTEPVLHRLAQRAAADEPLHAALRDRDEAVVGPLFGWTMYLLTLARFERQTRARRAAARQQLAELPVDRKGRPEDPDAAEAIESRIALHDSLLAAASLERKQVEAAAMTAYWAAYAEAAAAFVELRAVGEDDFALRAMLRCHVVCRSPALVDRELLDALDALLQAGPVVFQPGPDATPILYADQYFELVAEGAITPSPDEDLELNGKGSDPWKRDRMWRTAVNQRNLEAGLQVVLDQTRDRLKELEAKLEHDRNLPPELVSASDLAELRTEVGRAGQTIQRIDEQLIPAACDAKVGAQTKLEEIGGEPEPAELARGEADRLHRMARLLGRLKDPFPPLAVVEAKLTAKGAINDQQTLQRDFADAERRDPRIFSEVIVPNRKLANRVHLRQHPYVVVIPVIGAVAHCWAPRNSAEAGRLAMPLFNQRPGLLESMLPTVLADYRWDTSKLSAGVDLLTSDTVVSAYCTVRWNYRKKGKDRREKAAIYTEENDRTNWRRHYRLYLQSAFEGGKKLFFKCPEVYDALVKYHGLPDGVQKLKRL